MILDLQRFAETVDSSQGLLATGVTLSFKKHGDATAEPAFLNDVKTIPEIGQSPEKVDVTVLTDKKKKAINGLQDSSSLAFACVYKGANFKAAQGISDNGEVYDWTVTYPDGMTCTFTGQASIKIGQAGINEAMTFTVTVVVSEGPDFKAAPDKAE